MKILLACGVGASSGYIAKSMRKAAKKQGIEVEIKAVSDIEIENNMDDVNVLMIGPHIAHRYDDLVEKYSERGTKVLIINRDRYSMLDGAGALEDAIAVMNN